MIIVYLCGGKIFGKVLTNLLDEMFHPGKPQSLLGQKVLGESQGERERERQRQRQRQRQRDRETERQRETERDRERQREREIMIQGTVQGKISVLSRSLWFRWISHFSEEKHSCPRFFSPYWYDSLNMAITFTALHWKIGVRAPLWHPFPLKWHDVGIRVKDSIYFP